MTDYLKILEKINNQKDPQNSDSSILCDVCQVPLTDPISMDAGKGPVCRTRARFAEKLSRDQLAAIEGTKSPLTEDKINFKTTVVRIKGEEHPFLITIVGNVGNDIVFFDRQEYDKLYDQNMSVTDSIIKSFKIAKKENFESIAPLIEPKDNTLSESLKNFHNSYREGIKSREREWRGTGFQLNSKKLLDKDQLEDRKIMIKNYRADNNSKFKTKWINGEYPLATIMSRLSDSTISGAADLLAVFRNQFSEIKPRDFGLTDNEIIHGLNQARLPIERKIFNFLLKGKGNLTELAEIYKMIKDKNPEGYKRLNDITN